MSATGEVPREAKRLWRGGKLGHGILLVDGGPVAVAYSGNVRSDGEANARRLIACWNALSGISSEEVERLGEHGHFARLAALERQRDDVALALNYLLNALSAPVGRRSVMVDVPDAIKEARAALAKVAT
jgi:hypothetical protein